MVASIDHLVIAVPDPDTAAGELSAALGLAFTGGGRHPGAGTYNRIAFLGDAYLELIGVDDRELAEANAIGAAVVRALDAGGGLATYALVDDEIETTVARLGTRSMDLRYRFRRQSDGVVAAEVRHTVVTTDLSRVVSTDMPADVRAVAEQHLEAPA